MTLRESYDKICRQLGSEADERTFLAYFEATLRELEILVEQKYLWKNDVSMTKTINDEEIWCNSLFHDLICDNILYLFTNDFNYKNEFLRKTELAKNMSVKNMRKKHIRLNKYGW